MWQEGKRVFANRKFLIFITIIMVLNLFFFLDDQRKEYASVLAAGESFGELTANLESCILEYNALILDTDQEEKEAFAEELEKELWQYSGESQAEFENRNYLWKQAKALAAYGEEKELRRQNLKRYQSISIFQKEDSAAVESGEKTLKDYERIASVEPEFGNYRLAESLTDAGMTKYLYFLLLIYLCMSFLEERKTGFLGIVYLAAGGRGRLEAKRIGLLFFCAAFFAVILYGTMFFAALCCYGGIGDLGNPVQSVAQFQSVTIPVTIGQFLAILLLLQILGGFLLALFMHLIFLVCVNQIAAIGIIGLYGLAGAFFWKNITAQSKYMLWKYCNAVSLLEVAEISKVYENIRLFGHIFGLHEVLLVVAAGSGIAAFFTVLFLAEHMYPFGRWDIFAGVGRRFQKIWSAVMRHDTYIGFELHKLLFQQKGYLVLLLFTIVAWHSARTQQITFDSLTQYKNYYYEQYAGEADRYTVKEIRKEAEKIEEKERELAQLEQSYQNGEIGTAEYQMKLGEGAYLSYKKEALECVWEDVASLMTAADESGETLSLVNPLGWGQLIGTAGQKENQQIILQEIGFLILLFAGIIAYEYQTGAVPLLRGSKGGRERNYSEKFIMAELITALMTATDFYIRYRTVAAEYGLVGIEAPVQSLSALHCFPFSCSIRTYLVIGILGKWLVYSAIIAFLFFLSVQLKNSIKALAVSFACIELPGFLGWREVPVFRSFSILKIADWNQVMTDNAADLYLPLLMFLCVAGVAAAFFLLGIFTYAKSPESA